MADPEHEKSIQEIVNSLLILKEEYQNEPSKMSNRHIGECINEIASKVPRVHRGYLQIRRVVYSIMKLVLLQVQDKAKLDELNDNKLSPLHVAVRKSMPDCVEILLAAGANPEKRGYQDETPHEYLFSVRPYGLTLASAIHSAFLLDKLFKHWQGQGQQGNGLENISLWWIDSKTSQWQRNQVTLRLGEMLELKSSADGTRGQGTGFKEWVHVPVISAHALLAIFRTLDGIINEERHERFPTSAASIFIDKYTHSTITSSNLLLSSLATTYLPSDKKVEGWSRFTVVVFPCLVPEKMGRFRSQRARYENLKQFSPPSISADQWILRDILQDTSGIHLDRTLDEAYYPGLDGKFFKSRNEDQVISREYKRTQEKKKDNTSTNEWKDNTPILMVPQLWLWKMDQVLLSAFSRTRYYSGLGIENFPHVWNDARFPLTDLQIGTMIAQQIEAFGKKYVHEDKDVTYKPALDVFDAAVVNILSDARDYFDTSHSFTVHQSRIADNNFVHLIFDIHNELDMIQSVLVQQEEVLNKLMEDTKEGRRDTALSDMSDNWRRVEDAKQLLGKYRAQITKIHRDADRVEKTIDNMLNLKRTYAGMQDARNSLYVAAAAAVFAIITIIFTPLSFMASYLALPIDHLEKQKGSRNTTEKDAKKDADTGENKLYRTKYTVLSFISAELVTLLASGLLVWLATFCLKHYLEHQGEKPKPEENPSNEPRKEPAKSSSNANTRTRINETTVDQGEKAKPEKNPNEEPRREPAKSSSYSNTEIIMNKTIVDKTTVDKSTKPMKHRLWRRQDTETNIV